MDVEYARLANMIELPAAMEPLPRATVRVNAAPSYVSATAVCIDFFLILNFIRYNKVLWEPLSIMGPINLQELQTK